MSTLRSIAAFSPPSSPSSLVRPQTGSTIQAQSSELNPVYAIKTKNDPQYKEAIELEKRVFPTGGLNVFQKWLNQCQVKTLFDNLAVGDTTEYPKLAASSYHFLITRTAQNKIEFKNIPTGNPETNYFGNSVFTTTLVRQQNGQWKVTAQRVVNSGSDWVSTGEIKGGKLILKDLRSSYSHEEGSGLSMPGSDGPTYEIPLNLLPPAPPSKK